MSYVVKPNEQNPTVFQDTIMKEQELIRAEFEKWWIVEYGWFPTKGDSKVEEMYRAYLAASTPLLEKIAEQQQAYDSFYSTFHKYWAGTVNELVEEWQKQKLRIAVLEEQLRVRNEQMTRIGNALNPEAKSMLWENIAEGAVQRIAELEKDAARLEWCMKLLFNGDSLVTDIGCGCCGDQMFFDTQVTARQAIDTAIQHKEQT